MYRKSSNTGPQTLLTALWAQLREQRPIPSLRFDLFLSRGILTSLDKAVLPTTGPGRIAHVSPESDPRRGAIRLSPFRRDPAGWGRGGSV